MQNQTHTQTELKNVLKKLICERQRVKTLEQPQHDIHHTKASSAYTSQVSVATSDHEIQALLKEKDRQITVLKDVVRALGEKIKSEIHDQKSLATPNEQAHAYNEQLENSIEETKEALSSAQEKNRALEDELERNEKSRCLLLEQLKEQNAKVIEFDLVKKEYEKSRNKIYELEKALSALKQQASHYIGAKSAHEGDKESSYHELEEELAKYKKLTCEKELALAQIQQAYHSQLEYTKAKEQEFERELKYIQSQYETLKKDLDEKSIEKKEADLLKHASHHNSIHASDTRAKEIEELKAKLFRFASANRELQVKIDELTKERTCLVGRLKENSVESERKEKTEKELVHRLEVLQQEKTLLEESADKARSELSELRSLLDEMKIFKEQRDELAHQLTKQETHFREIQQEIESTIQNEKQEKTILEQKLLQIDLELTSKQQEIKKLKQLLQDSEQSRQENIEHLKLLEQHLARRVKECALLSGQVEEYTESLLRASTQNEHHRQKTQELEELLAEQQHLMKHKELELLQQCSLKEEEIEKQKAKYESLFISWELQGRELQELKALQDRFNQLEQLFGKFGQIFQGPVLQEAQITQPAKVQEIQERPEILKARPSWDALASHFSYNEEKKPVQPDLLASKPASQKNDLFQ